MRISKVRKSCVMERVNNRVNVEFAEIERVRGRTWIKFNISTDKNENHEKGRFRLRVGKGRTR